MLNRVILSFLAVLLLLAGTAAGQNDGKSKPRIGKPFSVSGRVSEDGQSLIPINGDPWSVANPGVLAGHEGHQVKVKCQLSSASHDIRVLSVKVLAPQVKYTANPGVSAFRR
ncbi:MAG TPA: hypothetical protein VFN26_01505 [Candidatus Acidoferrum sp.]|nr:hypothetical protein [Candidatus Acidoferrum sp.]